MNLPAGFVEWLRTGERGLSSEAIAEQMSGLPVGQGYGFSNHPSDPADLRRCRLLLDRVPEWQPRMSEPRARSQFDQYQEHGQLHWRNRLCSFSQSRPEEQLHASEK